LEQDSLSRIETLENMIQQSIDMTEDLSKSVYDSLPELEEEIKNMMEEVKSFLSTMTSRGGEAEKDSFIEKLTTLRKGVTKSLENLTALIDIIDVLFKEVFQGKGNRSFIESIMDETNRVEAALEDLTSVALNASITSSQLGSEGGAFSMLSKEIERESVKIIKHFKSITNIIDRSFPSIGMFKETLDNFTEFTKLRTDFHALIEKFNEVEQKLVELEEVLNKEIDETSGSFPDIMADMVGQDIFRQQMEHILDFFNEVRNDLARTSEQKKKDSFLKFILEVSEDILTDSKKEFSKAFDQVENKLSSFTDVFKERIVRKAQKFAIFFSREDKDSLYRIIQEVLIITVRNAVFMEDILGGIADIKDSFGHFKENIHALQNEISGAVIIARRFKTMNILIKAELARLDQKLGKKAEGIKAEFDRAIEKVTTTTYNLERLTNEIMDLYHRNSDKFDKFKEYSGEMIKKGELKSTFEKLEQLVDSMNQSYWDMMNDFEKSLAQVDLLESDFKERLAEVKRKNDEIHQFVIDFDSDVPAYEQEFLQDPRLKALSEKFTTYRERVSASDHMEIEDVGSEGGEFTLF